MPAEGLNAEKLDVLRRWGTGLQRDEREEVAAAGRAIVLLIEEIERLHVLLWDRKLYPDAPIEQPTAGPGSLADYWRMAGGLGEAAAPAVEPVAEPLPETLGRSLRDRLRRRRSDRFSTA